MKLIFARALFFLARALTSRGYVLGQYFHNKGILALTKKKSDNRAKT